MRSSLIKVRSKLIRKHQINIRKYFLVVFSRIKDFHGFKKSNKKWSVKLHAIQYIQRGKCSQIQEISRRQFIEKSCWFKIANYGSASTQEKNSFWAEESAEDREVHFRNGVRRVIHWQNFQPVHLLTMRKEGQSIQHYRAPQRDSTSSQCACEWFVKQLITFVTLWEFNVFIF